MCRSLISISIVNHNSTVVLVKCLESIRENSDGLDIEILVVDNASETFEPYAIHEVFQDAVITRNPANMGFGFAHNQNFLLSHGELFFILNPDTSITEGCLSGLVDAFEQCGNAAIVSPTLLLKNKDNCRTPKRLPTLRSISGELIFLNNIARVFRRVGHPPAREQHRSCGVECINGAAFMIRRVSYESLNGFDERFFLYFEETDLCKRVRDILGMQILLLEDTHIHHLYGQSSISTDARQTIYYESCYKYFEKHRGIVIAIIVRLLIFSGELARLLGFQIKYFPPVKGWAVYCRKITTSFRLLSWALLNKSAADRYS